MIKKRIVLILLAMVMLVTAVPFVASAEYASGGFGDLLHYSVEDRTLIIKSTGGTSIEEDDLPWVESSWLSKIEVIVIKDGITSICNSAFADFPSLKRVVLPSTLTILHKWVFNRCTALEEVRFDNGYSLTTIGDKAFNTTSSNGIRFYVPTQSNAESLQSVIQTGNRIGNADYSILLSQAKLTGYNASIGSSLRMNFFIQVQNNKTPAELGLKAEFYRNDRLVQTVTADAFENNNNCTWTVTCDHTPPQFMGTDLIVKIIDKDGNTLCTGSCSFLRYCNMIYYNFDDLTNLDNEQQALKTFMLATLNFGEIARQNTGVVWAESLPSWVEQQTGVLDSESIEKITNKKASFKNGENSYGFQCVELLVDADSYLEFTINYESIGNITDIKVYRLPQDLETNKGTPLDENFDKYLTYSHGSIDDTEITLMTKPVSPVDFDTMFYIEIIGNSNDGSVLLDWATYSINSFIKYKLTESEVTESNAKLYTAYYFYGQAALAYKNTTTNN